MLVEQRMELVARVDDGFRRRFLLVAAGGKREAGSQDDQAW